MDNMNILNGVENFLVFLNNNWTTITVIIGLGIGIAKKIKSYIGKTNEEKIAIAKDQVRQAILKMITKAELDYEGWNKAGSIKRSQVIKEIFDNYPVLSKVIDYEELIQWIDTEIDNALVTLREVIKTNREVNN